MIRISLTRAVKMLQKGTNITNAVKLAVRMSEFQSWDLARYCSTDRLAWLWIYIGVK